MPQRRAFIGLIAAPLVCAWPATAGQAPSRSRPPRSPADPGYFPNVVLSTHHGRRVRFYDDLIKGKVVAVSFMFTSCSIFCPRATDNLLKVQARLGSRLGRDVFMLSITVDPEKDTPEVLKQYVAAHQVKPGWEFLTGERRDIDLIRRRLGVFDNDPDKSQHTGLLTYGNETTRRWSAMPVIAEPGVITRALLTLSVPNSRS
jgi:protein SCO1/2